MVSQKAKDWFEREYGRPIRDYQAVPDPEVFLPGPSQPSRLELDAQNEALANELARPICIPRGD
ncbi:hypothetical protein J4218_06255 [Candidatus Pacearchaeota archaeon]|nr:hypothetical protein [Candidatus Pacearchaeota archaeon]